MKSKHLPHDGPLPNDKTAFIDAIKALQDEGIPFTRPTLHQVKVGPWNFYPARGTIFHDGCERAECDIGVAALIARIKSQGPAAEATPKRPFRLTIVE